MRYILAGMVAVALVACASKAQVAPSPAVIFLGQAQTRPTRELLNDLRTGDSVTMSRAAYEFAGAGRVGTDVVQALLAALDDSNESVREGASWALFHVESPGLNYDSLLDTKPKVLRPARPIYPQEAFRKGIQGTVVVDILISAAGTVVHAEVRNSVPGLDAAAVDALRAWTFKPGLRKGKPVPVASSAPVSFKKY